MKKLLFHILLFCYLLSSAQVWPKYIGLQSRPSAKSIREHYDKGYLISGRAFNDHYGYLHKLDVNGNSLWEKFIGKSNYHTLLNNMDLSPDNSLYTSGSCGKLDELGDPIVIKLNPCAEIEWCRLLHTPDNMDYARFTKATPDGGALVLTSYHSSDPEQERIHLIKFNASGNRQWQQLYGQSDPLFHSEEADEIEYLTNEQYNYRQNVLSKSWGWGPSMDTSFFIGS